MGKNMETTTIHGKPITYDENIRLGMYFDETGWMPIDYRDSDPKEAIEIFNGTESPAQVRTFALNLVERANRQLNHQQKQHIPNRFRIGLENAVKLYQSIADAMGQPANASQSANRPS